MKSVSSIGLCRSNRVITSSTFCRLSGRINDLEQDQAFHLLHGVSVLERTEMVDDISDDLNAMRH